MSKRPTVDSNDKHPVSYRKTTYKGGQVTIERERHLLVCVMFKLPLVGRYEVVVAENGVKCPHPVTVTSYVHFNPLPGTHLF